MTAMPKETRLAIRIEEYAEPELASALAARVAEDLDKAIGARGRASLAVPGGRTPADFLRSLGRITLPWDRVTVTLTDERSVSAQDSRSNQRLLVETLFAGPAASAQFIALYNGAREPALSGVAATLEGALPLDVAVLGMGDDMHTASLFPDSPELPQALDPAGKNPVLAISAPSVPEPRVTLTLPALAGAARVYLLIKGPAKRASLEQALAAGDPQSAPIRAVLEAAADPVVFYAD